MFSIETEKANEHLEVCNLVIYFLDGSMAHLFVCMLSNNFSLHWVGAEKGGGAQIDWILIHIENHILSSKKEKKVSNNLDFKI